jgi:hypothetical protein
MIVWRCKVSKSQPFTICERLCLIVRGLSMDYNLNR